MYVDDKGVAKQLEMNRRATSIVSECGLNVQVMGDCFIAKQFNIRFPGIKATVGGDTGIDISPVGTDKAQIITDFDPKDKTYFFGDRMDEDGNDYPLAQVVDHKRAVLDWQQTKEYLTYFQEANIAR